MQGLIVRILITMLGLFLASRLVPGVWIEGMGSFILAALLLGIVNALWCIGPDGCYEVFVVRRQ